MKFTHQFNPEYKPEIGEINTLPSLTVPDQNLSMQQLLLNHTRGIPSRTGMKEPMYFDTLIPKIQDLNDLEDYKEQLQEQINELDTQAKSDIQKAEEKRQAKIQNDKFIDSKGNPFTPDDNKPTPPAQQTLPI